ncbi:MAG: class I SAM-dependent methyltransferase [Candidatus Hydrogenedentes bacterium]|nr:class I SAM-dependent methyltransferase [Candidatus Hydrogenedentota bacterium]
MIRDAERHGGVNASEQAALFDRLASGEALYVYSDNALRIVDSLVGAKGRVLDVGCGDGAIAGALGGCSAVGFDISPRCAALAKQRGVKAVVADAAAGIPFRDGAFDTVYCVDVLHHLGGAWERVLGEIDRVLRPGGTAAVVEPDARNALVRWTQAPRSPIRVAPYGNEPAIDPAELAPLLEHLGYAVECRRIHIEGRQVERSVFPLWQRALKAPFVLALALMYGSAPNKFALLATKPE